MFLEKLRAQGWVDLFRNIQLGCSVPNLAEFYANYKVTNGVVTSEVNGKKLCFNAKKLGEILGVSAVGFDVYVREDKSMLGTTRLLELAQKFSQQTGLQTPQSVKKGDMRSIHQLGEILGVSAVGFDVYVREDKSMLGTTRLLELA